MKRSILFTITKILKCSLYLLLLCAIFSTILLVNNMSYAYAQNQNVQYKYDPSGRLTAVKYPDGTEIKYQYDVNGNILSSEKVSGQVLPDDKQTGGEETGGNQTGGSQTGGGQTGGNQTGGSQTGGEQTGGNQTGGVQDTDKSQSGGSTQKPGSEPGSVQKPSAASSSTQYSATDIKNYNKFKKSKPVIKSLKQSKKKNKYYLTIRIKQIKKRGTYGEIGYHIKYATNSKFKKAKTLKITRNKKGSITSKKWKVKKGKTYYVKVRAYMKTKTGKTIYSKYNKVKKIKVKKK